MTLNKQIQNILKNSKKDPEWKKEAEERLKARTESKKSGMIATQLAIYMAEKGISQTELGKMTGVSPQQISKVLKGRENLTLATIEKIEKALEVELIQVNNLEEAEFKRLKEPKFEKNKLIDSVKGPYFIANVKYRNDQAHSFIHKGILRLLSESKGLEVKNEIHMSSRSKKYYEIFEDSEPFLEYSQFSVKDHE